MEWTPNEGHVQNRLVVSTTLKNMKVSWDDDIPNTLWLLNIAMENGPFIDEFPS